jgi:hypothetical protein
MKRFLGWVGVAALGATPAFGQQRVNPVTINPGAGRPGGSGSPSTSRPTGRRSATCRRSGASTSGATDQDIIPRSPARVRGCPGPGYGGFGLGPYGVVNANNPASSFPDPIEQQQRIALANSRYDLQTAQTTKAYAEANLLQQQAMAVARQNADAAPPVRERFSTRTGASRARGRAATATPTVPLDQLMTPEGQVQWPPSAPGGEARDRVDAAVAEIAQEFQKDGSASAQAVNEARDALYAYGLPALADVRKNRPAAGPEFKAFLNNMDAASSKWQASNRGRDRAFLPSPDEPRGVARLTDHIREDFSAGVAQGRLSLPVKTNVNV